MWSATETTPPGRRELHRIRDKVVQYLRDCELVAVGKYGCGSVHLQRHLLGHTPLSVGTRRGAHHGSHIQLGRSKSYAFAFYLVQVEELGDDRCHAASLGADGLDELESTHGVATAYHGAAVIQGYLYAGEGIFKVVGGDGEKLRLISVGIFQLAVGNFDSQ